MVTDRTAVLRKRRQRDRQRGVTVVLDEKALSRLWKLGKALSYLFGKAWFEFLRRHPGVFHRTVFTHLDDNLGGINSPYPDFEVGILCWDDTVIILIVEIKNWFAPQRLNHERTIEKIGKKFTVWQAVADERFRVMVGEFANLLGAKWDLEKLKDKVGDKFVKLVVCTDAIQFNDEAQRWLERWDFRVERVENAPFAHKDTSPIHDKYSVPESAYKAIEDRIVEQCVKILERVLLGIAFGAGESR